MFTDFLSYKLERAGKKLVRIDKWYPSSKICSCCGKLKKELKLEDRIYSCTCGNQMNRDENAAINIWGRLEEYRELNLIQKKFPDSPKT